MQLGFRTLRDAETYLNYFVSYYEWVKSGSTGILGPVPVGGGMGTIGGTGTGGIGAGGITAQAGNAMASAGGGGAFAQAGNAIAQAGNFLGNALGFGSGKSQKKIGSVPVLESIPRAQGPFRSGQDNMEPIYDNSGVKIGASRGSPLDPFSSDTTSQEEHEYGKSPRVKSRIQRHLNTALAIAGDRPEWVDAFLSAFEKMFGDLMINLTVNNMLDGYAINQSQKKYQVKKVSVYN